jgi:hypothetical protein
MKEKESKDKLPLNKALFWILLSTLFVTGTAGLGLLYFQYIKEMHAQDDTYRIVAIVQTTPEPEALKTVYLAELLDLSIDQPSNLYRFNTKEARRKLLASPLIKEAHVKKIRPGTVYVDYLVRRPIAFLTDYTNTVMDNEGVLFPYKPFFTPKKLPEVYLGIQHPIEQTQLDLWGRAVHGKQMELALSLLQFFNTEYCSETCCLRRIDVSKAYAPSCGQRQIVVVLEDQLTKESNDHSITVLCPHILRLNTDTYLQGVANYALLQDHLRQQKDPELQIEGPLPDIVRQEAKIFDLRLSQLAFISNEARF